MNKEQLEEMYADISKIGSLILDTQLFNHSDSMKDSFNIIYKSNSQIFRTVNEASVREDIAKHNVKCKADTVKLYLIAHCIDLLDDVLTKQQPNFVTLFEKYTDRSKDSFTHLYKPSYLANRLVDLKKMKSQIWELLPVMTAEKAKEVTAEKYSNYKSPLPYLLSGFDIYNERAMWETSVIKTVVAKSIASVTK